MRKLIVTLCLLCVVLIGRAEEMSAWKVYGNVYDAVTHETLPGASVVEKGLTRGSITDLNGHFELTLYTRHATLSISYVGYKSQEVNVVNEASVGYEIYLTPTQETLEEVTISARKRDENVTRMVMGVEKLTNDEIKQIPAMLGEVDIVKAIQLLPGVLPVSEGGSGFSVRGGSPDQNLVLLDHATVYNPSHLLGFFSTFNNDAMSGAELYKGDIPLKYGGRLSSLLDVQTKDERADSLRLSGGVGLISSRLTVEMPVTDRTSVLLAGRRTYLDIFLPLNSATKDASLYFYDMNAKINTQISTNNNISLSGYYGKDHFGQDFGVFDYGNAAASLAWTHTFSDRASSKLTATWSDYKYSMEADYNTKQGIEAQIKEVALNADMFYEFNPDWRLGYGASASYHLFKPGYVWMDDMESYDLQDNKAWECAAYISNEHTLLSNLNVRYGVRMSSFMNIGSAEVFEYNNNGDVINTKKYKKGDVYHTYTCFEPRIGAVYQINDESSVKANYARNVQYMQLASKSSAGSPVDMWFPASPLVKPQKCDMVSLGYYRNLKNNMFETSVEVYYKKMANVIDFIDHQQLMLNKYLESAVRLGKGKSYGVELMVRKKQGALTGFASYTLSHSDRTVPEVNGGEKYLAPFDKTHSINISLNYKISSKHSLSAIWVYATGNPTTYPVGRFAVPSENNQEESDYFPIYSKRNEYRKPDYHRLDLAWTYTPNPDSNKRWKGEWCFSLYNAYGRKNPWMINYQFDDGGMPYAEKTYLFTFIPSVTYNFKF